MAESTHPISEPLAGIISAVQAAHAALPPVVAEAARIGAQIRETAQPFIDALTAAQQSFAAILSPGDVEFLVRLVENSRWVREAPQALQSALAGKTVIHQELSLPDMGAIIGAFNKGGEEAALVKVQQLHEELLVDCRYRERFRARWEQTGRLPIMNDVLATYDAALYFATVPPALAQAEGIVADFFGLEGLKFPELKQRVRDLHGADDLFEPLVTDFLEGLLAPFAHGKPVPQLNRHAVQHGGDKAYGTKVNAIAAIIWADYLLGVTIEARENRNAEEAPGE